MRFIVFIALLRACWCFHPSLEAKNESYDLSPQYVLDQNQIVPRAQVSYASPFLHYQNPYIPMTYGYPQNKYVISQHDNLLRKPSSPLPDKLSGSENNDAFHGNAQLIPQVLTGQKNVLKDLTILNNGGSSFANLKPKDARYGGNKYLQTILTMKNKIPKMRIIGQTRPHYDLINQKFKGKSSAPIVPLAQHNYPYGFINLNTNILNRDFRPMQPVFPRWSFPDKGNIMNFNYDNVIIQNVEEKIFNYITGLIRENYLSPGIIKILNGAKNVDLSKLDEIDEKQLIEVSSQDLRYLKQYLIQILNIYGLNSYTIKLLEYIYLVEGTPKSEIYLMLKILADDEAAQNLNENELQQLKRHLLQMYQDYNRSPYMLAFLKNILETKLRPIGNIDWPILDVGHSDKNIRNIEQEIISFILRMMQGDNYNSPDIIKVLNNAQMIDFSKLHDIDENQLIKVSDQDIRYLKQYLIQILNIYGLNSYSIKLLEFIYLIEGTPKSEIYLMLKILADDEAAQNLNENELQQLKRHLLQMYQDYNKSPYMLAFLKNILETKLRLIGNIDWPILDVGHSHHNIQNIEQEIISFILRMMQGDNYNSPDIIKVLNNAQIIDFSKLHDIDENQLIKVSDQDIRYLKQYLIQILNIYGLNSYTIKLLEYIYLIEGTPKSEIYLMLKILADDEAAQNLNENELQQLKRHLLQMYQDYNKSPYMLAFLKNILETKLRPIGNIDWPILDVGHSHHNIQNIEQEIISFIMRMMQGDNYNSPDIIKVLNNAQIIDFSKLDDIDENQLIKVSDQDIRYLKQYLIQILNIYGINSYTIKLLEYIYLIEGTPKSEIYLMLKILADDGAAKNLSENELQQLKRHLLQMYQDYNKSPYMLAFLKNIQEIKLRPIGNIDWPILDHGNNDIQNIDQEIISFVVRMMISENYISPDIIKVLNSAQTIDLYNLEEFNEAQVLQVSNDDMERLKKYLVQIVNLYGLTMYAFKLMEYILLMEGRPKSETHLMSLIIADEKAVQNFNKNELKHLQEHLHQIYRDYSESPYILAFLKKILDKQFKPMDNNISAIMDFNDFDVSNGLQQGDMQKIYLYLSHVYSKNLNVLKILKIINDVYGYEGSDTLLPVIDQRDLQSLATVRPEDLNLLVQYILQVISQRGNNIYFNGLLSYISWIQNPKKDTEEKVDLSPIYQYLLELKSSESNKEIHVILDRLSKNQNFRLPVTTMHSIETLGYGDLIRIKEFLLHNESAELNPTILDFVNKLNEAIQKQEVEVILEGDHNLVEIIPNDLKLLQQYMINKRTATPDYYLDEILQLIKQVQKQKAENEFVKLKYFDLMQIYKYLLQGGDINNPVLIKVQQYVNDNNKNRNIQNDSNYKKSDINTSKINTIINGNQINLEEIYKFLLLKSTTHKPNPLLLELLNYFNQTLVLPNGQLKIKIISLNNTNPVEQISHDVLEKILPYLVNLKENSETENNYLYKGILQYLKNQSHEKDYGVITNPLSVIPMDSLYRIKQYLQTFINQYGENQYVNMTILKINEILKYQQIESNPQIINNLNANEDDFNILLQYLIEDFNVPGSNSDIMKLVKYIQKSQKNMINPEDYEKKKKLLRLHLIQLINNADITPVVKHLLQFLMVDKMYEDPSQLILELENSHKLENLNTNEIYELIRYLQQTKSALGADEYIGILIDNIIRLQKEIEYNNRYNRIENHNTIPTDIHTPENIKENKIPDINTSETNTIVNKNQSNLEEVYKFLLLKDVAEKPNPLLLELIKYLNQSQVLSNGQHKIKIISSNNTNPVAQISRNVLENILPYLVNLKENSETKNDYLYKGILQYLKNQSREKGYEVIINPLSIIPFDALYRIKQYLQTFINQYGENQYVYQIILKINDILKSQQIDYHPQLMNNLNFEEDDLNILLQYLNKDVNVPGSNSDIMKLVKYVQKSQKNMKIPEDYEKKKKLLRLHLIQLIRNPDITPIVKYLLQFLMVDKMYEDPSQLILELENSHKLENLNINEINELIKYLQQTKSVLGADEYIGIIIDNIIRLQKEIEYKKNRITVPTDIKTPENIKENIEDLKLSGDNVKIMNKYFIDLFDQYGKDENVAQILYKFNRGIDGSLIMNTEDLRSFTNYLTNLIYHHGMNQQLMKILTFIFNFYRQPVNDEKISVLKVNDTHVEIAINQRNLDRIQRYFSTIANNYKLYPDQLKMLPIIYHPNQNILSQQELYNTKPYIIYTLVIRHEELGLLTKYILDLIKRHGMLPDLMNVLHFVAEIYSDDKMDIMVQNQKKPNDQNVISREMNILLQQGVMKNIRNMKSDALKKLYIQLMQRLFASPNSWNNAKLNQVIGTLLNMYKSEVTPANKYVLLKLLDYLKNNKQTNYEALGRPDFILELMDVMTKTNTVPSNSIDDVPNNGNGNFIVMKPYNYKNDIEGALTKLVKNLYKPTDSNEQNKNIVTNYTIYRINENGVRGQTQPEVKVIKMMHNDANKRNKNVMANYTISAIRRISEDGIGAHIQPNLKGETMYKPLDTSEETKNVVANYPIHEINENDISVQTEPSFKIEKMEEPVDIYNKNENNKDNSASYENSGDGTRGQTPPNLKVIPIHKPIDIIEKNKHIVANNIIYEISDGEVPGQTQPELKVEKNTDESVDIKNKNKNYASYEINEGENPEQTKSDLDLEKTKMPIDIEENNEINLTNYTSGIRRLGEDGIGQPTQPYIKVRNMSGPIDMNKNKENIQANYTNNKIMADRIRGQIQPNIKVLKVQSPKDMNENKNNTLDNYTISEIRRLNDDGIQRNFTVEEKHKPIDMDEKNITANYTIYKIKTLSDHRINGQLRPNLDVEKNQKPINVNEEDNNTKANYTIYKISEDGIRRQILPYVKEDKIHKPINLDEKHKFVVANYTIYKISEDSDLRGQTQPNLKEETIRKPVDANIKDENRGWLQTNLKEASCNDANIKFNLILAQLNDASVSSQQKIDLSMEEFLKLYDILDKFRKKISLESHNEIVPSSVLIRELEQRIMQNNVGTCKYQPDVIVNNLISDLVGVLRQVIQHLKVNGYDDNKVKGIVVSLVNRLLPDISAIAVGDCKTRTTKELMSILFSKVYSSENLEEDKIQFETGYTPQGNTEEDFLHTLSMQKLLQEISKYRNL